MGSGAEGIGGAGAVRRWRSKPSGEAIGGVQNPEMAELSELARAAEQMGSVRELWWSEVVGN
jgi:hypothetical protein